MPARCARRPMIAGGRASRSVASSSGPPRRRRPGGRRHASQSPRRRRAEHLELRRDEPRPHVLDAHGSPLQRRRRAGTRRLVSLAVRPTPAVPIRSGPPLEPSPEVALVAQRDQAADDATNATASSMRHRISARCARSPPAPLISMRTSSPRSRKVRGSIATPTPLGVPVRMRSPGSSVIASEMKPTSSSGPKTRSSRRAVLAQLAVDVRGQRELRAGRRPRRPSSPTGPTGSCCRSPSRASTAARGPGGRARTGRRRPRSRRWSPCAPMTTASSPS